VSSQMTIGKKLMISFGTILALVIALSYAYLSATSNLGKAVLDAYEVNGKKLDLSGQITNWGGEMAAFEKGIVLRAYTKDAAKMAENDQAFKAANVKLEKTMSDLEPMLITDAAKKMLATMQHVRTSWIPLHEELTRLAMAGQADAAMQVHVDKVMPLIATLSASTDDLTAAVWKVAQTEEEDANSTLARSRWIAFLLIGVGVVMGAVVFFVIRNINQTLRFIVSDLKQGGEQVASASGQVSASSQSLAQGASEQAASLEETSASSEEINSMAQKNTENSRQAADLVTQSQQKFGEANQMLQLMVVAMGEINASSDKISKIIKVIDEIAFQTNILALNAAVEAARAGEAGMGFAVVADEVRNLAQRCAQAAKDTAALIEESITKSNDGKTKVDRVAESIHLITEQSANIKTLVDEVRLGSEEQARGIEQVAKAVNQMEQVTQKTAANAEESASAGEELNAQAEALEAIVERLTVMVGGGDSDDRGTTARGRKPGSGLRGRGPARPRTTSTGRELTALNAATQSAPGGRSATAGPEESMFEQSQTPAF
jgi:methyl-accepting chemotaxis protein